MLYLHCLIIRSYRFSRILSKGKKNYMSPPRSLIWPIRGCAAGPGYGFRRLCPKQGYMISHESVLNSLSDFLRAFSSKKIESCPKRGTQIDNVFLNRVRVSNPQRLIHTQIMVE